MDEIIRVTDEQDTLLKPLDAQVEVLYQYEGEATPELVLDTTLQRGVVMDTAFPAADPTRTLEFSQIKIDPSMMKGGLRGSYKSKTQTFEAKIPEAVEDIALEAIRAVPTISPDEIKQSMDTRRLALLAALIQRYPPQNGLQEDDDAPTLQVPLQP